MHIRRWLVAIIIIVVTVAGLGAIKYNQVMAAIAYGESFPEPSASVKTVTTQITSFTPQEKVTGQVTAKQVVTLQNELGGVIKNVGFKPGEAVKKGQLLLAFDVSQEFAQLNAAKANYLLTKNTLTRFDKLLKQRKVSQQDFDLAQANYEVAKANIANLNSVIAKKKLLAPFAGKMGLDVYQVGQFLPQQTSISTLIGSTEQLWVDFKLPQTSARLSLEDTVMLQAINDTNAVKVAAKIIAIDSQVNAKTRQLKYRALVENTNGQLHHNEMINVYLPRPSVDAVIVPNLSIGRNGTETFVYQLKKDPQGQYRAHKANVIIGQRQGDNQLILSGIDAQQLIATEGAFKLRQGLLVYPQFDDAKGVN